MSEPYQLLPPLTSEERDALRESIATFGVLQPVVVDENGAIIDGHHRSEIAAELGVTCETVVLPGLTEEQKLEQALVLNLARRHLDPEQKRALAAELRSRGLSVRWISERTGIPRSTVQRAVSGVPAGTPEYVAGRDGKHYRAQRALPDVEEYEAQRLAEQLDQLHRWLNEPLAREIIGAPVERDDPALPWVLYTLAVSDAAKALIRSGELPERPRHLHCPSEMKPQHSYARALSSQHGQGRRLEPVREEVMWQVLVERRAAQFFDWCEKVHVDLFDNPKQRVTVGVATVPDPLDTWVAGVLWVWLGWVPDVPIADVLTWDERFAMQEPA